MIHDPISDLDFAALKRDWPATYAAIKALPDVDMLEGRQMPVHFYWRVPKPFERKQIICIKSFIATQNIDQLQINLWSNVDLSRNEWLRPWLPYVTLRRYNPIEEARGTILEGQHARLTSDDPACFLGGDLFRAMILHNHGGVYFDVDTIFLRDIRVCLGEEFMYWWGTHDEWISSAAMMLHARGDLSNRLMQGILELDAGGTNWACMNNVRAYAIKPFRVFPAGFWNPEWQIGTRDCSFEINELSGETFEGTFTHHWHNRWEKQVLSGCKFELLEKLTDRKLREKGLLR